MLTSGDLYDSFRTEVSDAVAPYLWSEAEVFTYINDAYVRFARLTGGIADSTSPATQVPVVIGEKDAAVSPLILRFRQAWLASSGIEVDIVNIQDPALRISNTDYGRIQVRDVLEDNTPGPVRRMIIGRQRNSVRWVQVPVENDTVQLSVYRLPLDTVTSGDMFFMFPDIGSEYIEVLMLWVKSRAYGKQDADTFDKTARDMYARRFEDACALAKADWERYKHKTRTVAYGGI